MQFNTSTQYPGQSKSVYVMYASPSGDSAAREGGMTVQSYAALVALVDGFCLHRTFMLLGGYFTPLNCLKISSACCLRCFWVSALRESTPSCWKQPSSVPSFTRFMATT